MYTIKKAVFYGAGEELDTFFANDPVFGFEIAGVVDSRKAGQGFYGTDGKLWPDSTGFPAAYNTGRGNG